MSTSKNKKYDDKWVKELIEIANSVVEGYERYLLDTLNYNDLAKIIKLLKNKLDKDKK
tara:strand:- start:122 stop:295 length:174 start_codon:yes stop_codon:yes gene_type:complete